MRLAFSAASLLTVLSLALLCAECANEQRAAPTAASPKLDMDGRWVLAAPNAPTCGMVFESAADGMQGTVTPDGGCPGELYTSRQWQLVQGQLTINDPDARPLAQFTFAGNQFKGQTSDGLPVTLRH
jgi:hypothetical protein